MKHYTKFILFCIIMSSCDSEDPMPDHLNLKNINIDDIEAVTTEIPFEVMLQYADGMAVLEGELMPSTEYLIVFESEVPLNYYIRITDGFEIQDDAEGSYPDTRKTIPIKTVEDLPQQLYLGLIPLIVNDNTYNKAPSKGFILP